MNHCYFHRELGYFILFIKSQLLPIKIHMLDLWISFIGFIYFNLPFVYNSETNVAG